MAHKATKDLEGIESEETISRTASYMEESEFGNFGEDSGAYTPPHQKKSFIGALGLAQADEVDDESHKI